MKDWIRAFLIGTALIALTIASLIVIAFLVPILSISLIIVVVWLVLKILQDDPSPPDEETKKPP